MFSVIQPGGLPQLAKAWPAEPVPRTMAQAPNRIARVFREPQRPIRPRRDIGVKTGGAVKWILRDAAEGMHLRICHSDEPQPTKCSNSKRTRRIAPPPTPHLQPSVIDHETITRSGNLPRDFLRDQHRDTAASLPHFELSDSEMKRNVLARLHAILHHGDLPHDVGAQKVEVDWSGYR